MAAERRAPAMGSTLHVVVHGADDALVDAAVRQVADLERRWSRYQPDSEISRLNAAGGDPVVVSAETFGLVARAVAGWRATGGAFDPTVLDAMEANGYRTSFEDWEHDAVDAGLPSAAPGCGEIELVDGADIVRLPAGVHLDPGGIGKGLAADLVATALVDAGAAGACVNVGGDLRVLGDAPRGSWTVAIDGDRRHLSLEHGAVATTTRTKRRWVGTDGEARHHVVDPRSGRPADVGVATVTVVAGEAWRAEVLAKALLVRGVDAVAAVVVEAGAAALVLHDDGSTTTVGPIEEYLT
jgi:thiamine biosynthesis lipoprotein